MTYTLMDIQHSVQYIINHEDELKNFDWNTKFAQITMFTENMVQKGQV